MAPAYGRQLSKPPVANVLRMPLKILGVNHRTAPVELREKVAFNPNQLSEALRHLVTLPKVEEVVIVSTCNRTELYGNYLDGGVRQAREWLMDYHRLPGAMDECLYTFDNNRAVSHTFSVACGLDSAILGEPQILGQMKDAYRTAKQAGTTGPVLHGVFQQAFSVAKQVRTDTDIGASAVSVAFAAVSMARQVFADFSANTALLIGAGETIELTARHLHARGLSRMVIANRSIARARALAQQYQGYAIELDEIPAHLADADIIIGATASPDPLVYRDDMERALKDRKHRPVFIADLAVPRDVEDSVADLDDVYLYTVDDLQGVIRENLKSRRQAARQAQQIIEAEVARYVMAQRVRDAAPTIRAMRGKADEIREDVAENARRLLARGRDPEEVLDFLARTLTNKLMHLPSSELRKAGERGDDEILRAARNLFGIADD
jgi:glutamyl-tRNA reductase